jgi:FAD/FMN-containing dehydrogenase
VPNSVPMDQLDKIVGKEHLRIESGRGTVSPENSQAVSEIVKLAGSKGFKIMASGSGSVVNPSTISDDATLVLKSDRMNQIVKVVPEDLYVILQAGFPLKELNRHLQEHNLFYPLGEGGYPGTVGGSVAVNLKGASGERRLQTRDYALALQVVDAKGEVLKVGARTFKSVTGYDLPRLFSGSWGTLGFITEVTLRLIPARKREDYPGIQITLPKTPGRMDLHDPRAALSLRIKRSLDPTGVFVGFESFAQKQPTA